VHTGGRRRRPIRTIALAVCVVAFALMLGGCGSTGSHASTDAGEVATTGAPAPTDGPAGTAPAGSVSFRFVATVANGPGPDPLPSVDQLGMVVLDGDGIVSASAAGDVNGRWELRPRLTAAGVVAFNQAAAECVAAAAACPSHQIAIVVDGTVVSAPSIMTSNFAADQITISGNWTQAQAEALAARITAAAHGT
jgi:preprotein translocase subunit SecD